MANACVVCGKQITDSRRKSCGKEHSEILRKEREKRWRDKDIAHYRQLARERMRRRRKLFANRIREIDSNRRLRNRLNVLIHYGGVTPRCQCCGESTVAFLTIDHVNGGGTKHLESLKGSQGLMRWLSKNNYPDGYRVLCYNCNCGRAKNNGVCPHNSLESTWAIRLQNNGVIVPSKRL